MRANKTPRTKTSKPARRGKRRIALTSAIGPRATTAIVVVVLAGGIWFGSRQHLSATTSVPTLSADAQAMDTTPEPPAPPSTSHAAKPHDSMGAPSTPDGITAAVSKAPVATLQGCLVKNGDAFRLKDPSGADAPKTRSWKSGFIKKSPATVDVVDPSASLGLGARVGTRVAVTGTLVDREMQAHAIHRVSSSCS